MRPSLEILKGCFGGKKYQMFGGFVVEVPVGVKESDLARFWGQRGTSGAGWGVGVSIPNSALSWEGCLRGTGVNYKAPRVCRALC